MESKPEARTFPGWAEPDKPGPVPAVAPEQPPSQRVGMSERDETERHLRWALAEDVLSIGEFDERLGQVIRAKTREDLDRIVADLPRPHPAAPPRTPLRPCSRIVAIMGGEDKRGRWRPGRPLRILAVMGGAKVDLRDAESDDGVFDIDALALMGGVEIVVPDDADVDLDGFAIMGGRDNKVPAAQTPGGPLVRVNGYAVMGGIVVRPASKRERRKHPVEGDDDGPQRRPQPPRPPVRYGDVPPRRKSWVGRIVGWSLVAALILGPGRAIITADEVAIFSGDRYEPTSQEEFGDDSVDVFTLFGGLEVVIPEGHSARVDSFELFGGTDCERVCDREGREIQVNATAIFGGVNVSDGNDPPDDDDD